MICVERGDMGWYLEVLKKYAVFSGRARRREFWYFQLFNFLIALVIAIIVGLGAGLYDGVTGTSVDASQGEWICNLYLWAMLLPSLAVSVRRLHDTNKSGWWLLLSLIPLLGIILLFCFVEDSQSGPNRFGPNPKEIATSQIARGQFAEEEIAEFDQRSANIVAKYEAK